MVIDIMYKMCIIFLVEQRAFVKGKGWGSKC